jgi:SH3-like domain-containing protein
MEPSSPNGTFRCQESVTTMYYRRTKTIAIGSALILGLGALTLIPADPARVAPGEIQSVTSAETVAAIDAMLGAGEATAAPTSEPEIESGIRPALGNASIQPAALQTEISEPPPVIDPSLRADAIGSKAVNLRAGPGTNSTTVTVLQPGQPVHAGAIENGWAQVTLDDGTTGWVYSRYLASVAATLPAEEPKSVETVAEDSPTERAVLSGGDGSLKGRTARIEARLAVRSEPDGDMLFRTEPGERVRILGTRGDWLKIRTADGTTGWIQRAG